MHQTLNSLKGTGFKLDLAVFKIRQAGFIFAGFEKRDRKKRKRDI